MSGLVLQLKPEIFSMLQKVQAKMVTVIKSVGNIEYDAYPELDSIEITQLATTDHIGDKVGRGEKKQWKLVLKG